MKIMHVTPYLIVLSLLYSSLLVAKKIFLTGGAGFIGSHVAQKLLERGDSVVIVDNMNDGYDRYIKEYNLSLVLKTDTKKNLSVYTIDICDTDAMSLIFAQEKPDVICHLAARAGVRQSINDPYEYCRSNNEGTLVVFEMARTYGIKHVVSASSSTVYGVRAHGPFYETDRVDQQSSPYGMTKRAGELLAYVYYHLFGISVTNLRFFSVYGPRGRMDMAPFIFMNAIDNDIPITVFGDGTVIRDFTYIDDIVNGILKALDNPLGYEIVNFGRGEPITLIDFIIAMEDVIGKKARIEYTEKSSGDAPMTHADIIKAKKLLNYAPQISVSDGLKKMYEWYKNQYLLLIKPKRSITSRVYIYEDIDE